MTLTSTTRTPEPRYLGDVLFVPAAKIYLKNRFFSTEGDPDRRREPYSEFRRLNTGICCTFDEYKSVSANIVLVITRLDLNLMTVLKLHSKYPNAKYIYLVTEEVTVCKCHSMDVLKHLPFDKILSWQVIENDNKFKRCFYPNPFLKPLYMTSEIRPFSVCYIGANKRSSYRYKGSLYETRLLMVREAVEMGVHVYGYGWEKELVVSESENYKGAIDNKLNILMKYNFCLCLENTRGEPNAISEKIFDCFAAGCIPIYLGCKDIGDFIPGGCYIDYDDFSSLQALLFFLKNLNVNDIRRYRRNIKQFMNSDKYTPFNTNGFVNLLSESVIEAKRQRKSSFSPYKLLKVVLSNLSAFTYSKRLLFVFTSSMVYFFLKSVCSLFIKQKKHT